MSWGGPPLDRFTAEGPTMMGYSDTHHALHKLDLFGSWCSLCGIKPHSFPFLCILISHWISSAFLGLLWCYLKRIFRLAVHLKCPHLVSFQWPPAWPLDSLLSFFTPFSSWMTLESGISGLMEPLSSLYELVSGPPTESSCKLIIRISMAAISNLLLSTPCWSCNNDQILCSLSLLNFEVNS